MSIGTFELLESVTFVEVLRGLARSHSHSMDHPAVVSHSSSPTAPEVSRERITARALRATQYLDRHSQTGKFLIIDRSIHGKEYPQCT